MMTHLTPLRRRRSERALRSVSPAPHWSCITQTETVWVLHPNAWSEEHRRTTHSRMCPVTSLDQVVFPLHKALL
mgnify:CR=1 FL=1